MEKLQKIENVFLNKNIVLSCFYLQKVLAVQNVTILSQFPSVIFLQS